MSIIMGESMVAWGYMASPKLVTSQLYPIILIIKYCVTLIHSVWLCSAAAPEPVCSPAWAPAWLSSCGTAGRWGRSSTAERPGAASCGCRPLPSPCPTSAVQVDKVPHVNIFTHTHTNTDWTPSTSADTQPAYANTCPSLSNTHTNKQCLHTLSCM